MKTDKKKQESPLIAPKGVDKISPLNELREEIAESRKKYCIGAIIAFVIADFMSGWIYQSIQSLYDKRFGSIGILNSFIYGITDFLLCTILIFIVVAGLMFRAYRAIKKNYTKNYDDNYLISKKETYGGAVFQKEEEMKETKDFSIYEDLNTAKGEILGYTETDKVVVFNYPFGLNRNRLYVGSPGSGKTSSVVKTALYQNMRQGISCCCTDTKGTLYQDTSNVFRENGYTVKSLILKPQQFKYSDSFNIFKTLHDDDELDGKASRYANIIIKTTGGDEETRYWSDNEMNLLKAIIMYVATEPSYIQSGRNNLPEVYNFITSHTAASMQGIFKAIPLSSPIRRSYEIFANCSEINQGQIINGLSIRLSLLSNIYLQQILTHDEIDLTEPMRSKCIYYIIMPDNDDTYKMISTLFFTSILMELCDYYDGADKKSRKDLIPVDIICDELINFGGIYDLAKKIATLRSRNIYLMLLLQGKKQLETVYTEQEASTILECCAVKGLLSTNDIDTAKYFSDLTGPSTVLAESVRYQEGAADIVHAHDTITKSLGEGQRNLMLYSELMNGKLKRDEVLYIISGMNPLKLKKCFAEKAGEPIHPCEKRAVELGEYLCQSHVPEWRKEFDRQIQRNAPNNTVYKAQPEAKPVQAFQTAKTSNSNANKYTQKNWFSMETDDDTPDESKDEDASLNTL